MSEFPDRPAPPRTVRERVEQWVQWIGPGRLVGSAVVVLTVLAGAYWLVRPPIATTESKLPLAVSAAQQSTTLPPTSTTAAASASIVVHVAGGVVAPGVYAVAEGARVIDAVQAAGGFAADANPDAVNLAALLADAQRVYVPRQGEAVVVDSGAGAVGLAAGPINLNSATAAQLDELPGVGPSTAAAILAHRQQHGPFATVEQLGDVRGIGPAKLDAIRGLVTV
ncbi:MAG: helix-hairpin-helix domain-containing protein [Actinomycetota bacterium]|nr:helix-hairpin-helix domain-containing protein [Actinomycetota bacterium]